MIKAIFWDNDGVLVNTEHIYYQATQHVLSTVGITLTPEQYLELFLVQGKGAWHLAEEKGFTASDIERLRTERNTLYGEWLGRAPLLIDGVAGVLAALHGQYVMGVVTSSRKDHFDVIHRASGLLKYFDFVLTGSDYTRVKPHPEPYLKAVERSGFSPEECLAVEDSERGLAAARAAGIGCIVVPTALTSRSNFVGARQVLGSITEIVTVLQRPEVDRHEDV
jgi:HAD superfamily hydrolase (TIGR01509 family)